MRDGQPYGTWEHGPLRDREGWRAWLEVNKHRFSREHRWRMGRPYGPSALLECLRHEATPFVIRAASYEELVVRYGLNVPFEPELQVRQQLRFLAKIEGWARTESARADTGS
jgi:hypothetical protein